MIDEEKNFDEILRKKLESRAFEFNEASWKKAEQLIDAEKPSRKRMGFWLFAGLLILAGGIALATWNFSDDAKTIAQTENQTGSITAGENGNSAGQNNPAPVKAANGASSSSMPNGAAQANSNTVPQLANTQSQIPASNGIPASNKTEQKTSQPGKNKTPRARAHQSQPGQPSGPGSQVAPQKNPAPVQQPLQNGGNGQENQGNSNPLPTDQLVITPGNGNGGSNEQPAQTKPGNQIPGNTEVVPDSTIIPTAITNSDSTHAPEKTPPPPSKTKGVNYFFLEAGASFMPGFSSRDNTGKSLNPIAGAGYHIRLKGNFALNGAIHYTYLNHVSDSSKIYNSNNYSFGVENNKTVIGLRRLHYVSVPVTLWWHVDQKNSVFGGFGMNYMFATESEERTYTETYGSITDENVKSVFGYGLGISKYDAFTTFGYQRNFGANWHAQLSGYYGFIDVKQNSFYPGNFAERNKGLRFMIQYSF
jgi:hypothetical protein